MLKNQPLKLFRTYSKNGLSLLRPLPLKRTCESSNIPQEYCICHREFEIDTNDLNALAAAKHLVMHLNQMFEENKITNLCEFLKLNALKNVQILLPNAQMESYFL